MSKIITPDPLNVVEVLNKSMEFLSENYQLMISIHDSIAKMSENQTRQAKLLTQIAEILNITVVNTKEGFKNEPN